MRRAILARLCLAADPDVLWPFRGNLGVDSLLSDDETGRAGAQAGPTSLRLLEFSSAAAPSREAVDFLTPHDEENRARRQHLRKDRHLPAQRKRRARKQHRRPDLEQPPDPAGIGCSTVDGHSTVITSMARRSPVGRYNMGLVVRVNEKDAIVRVVPEPWPALGDVRRRMTLGQLELKEDEACVIEPRPPVDEAVFAQLESGLEGETESSP